MKARTRLGESARVGVSQDPAHERLLIYEHRFWSKDDAQYSPVTDPLRELVQHEAVIDAVKKDLIYFGDNLVVLRESINDESVDLVYLDPPFNSNATYKVLFKSPKGHSSHAQIEAFEDTWH